MEFSKIHLKFVRHRGMLFLVYRTYQTHDTFSQYSSSFVCSLNPIRQPSIPRPYTVIYLLNPFTIVFHNRLNTYPFRTAPTPAC